ncbi:MAG: hypothetical protein AAGG44_16130, partial [Planctomycetota bacterium]
YDQCEIELVDATQGDNLCYHSFISSSPPHILIVRSRGEGASGTDYLASALAPFGEADSRNDFRITISTASQLRQALGASKENRPQANPKTNRYDCVVLQGVKRLDDKTTKRLNEFVRSGGGLVLCPSADCDFAWCRDVLREELALLPAWYDAIAEANDLKIANQPISGTNLEALNPVLDQLAKLRFERLIPLSSEHSLATGSDSASLEFIRFEDGTPFFALSRIDRGAVGQLCLPLDGSLSNVHLSPAMVPLVQRIVRSTLLPPLLTNVNAGDTWRLHPINDDARVVQWQPSSESIQVSLQPSSRPIDLVSTNGVPIESVIAPHSDASLDPFLTVSDTVRAGLYRVGRKSIQTDLADSKLDPLKFGFAVQATAAESDPRSLTQSEIESLALRSNARLIGSASEFLSGIRSGGAREIWRPLIIGLMTLLFAESWLAGRIMRGTGSAD